MKPFSPLLASLGALLLAGSVGCLGAAPLPVATPSSTAKPAVEVVPDDPNLVSKSDVFDKPENIGPIPALNPDAVVKAKYVGLDQRLKSYIPLDLRFRDENGRAVRLADYYGAKPVMLIIIQYRCQMLCGEEVIALSKSLKELAFTPGKDFTLLTVSIDPREEPGLALEKKKTMLADYKRPGAEQGWHFLVGDLANITALTKAVGYRYLYDPKTDQFAHPDGVIVTTPKGEIARYFFRLEYPASGLRLALVEASKGKIGNPIDALALLCYHYNPTTGKYGLEVVNLVRMGGVVTLLLMLGGFGLLTRKRDPQTEAPPATTLSSDPPDPRTP